MIIRMERIRRPRRRMQSEAGYGGDAKNPLIHLAGQHHRPDVFLVLRMCFSIIRLIASLISSSLTRLTD